MNQFMKSIIISGAVIAITFCSFSAYSQNASSANVNAQVINADQEKKAAGWVQSLHLNNSAKEKQLTTLIAGYLQTIHDWHNNHPYTDVPAGINPETGQPLSKLDRQMIIDSSIPDSVHRNFMNGLQEYLNEEQIDAVLDKYTVGKVAFTLKGYKAIVPDLTSEEETAIAGYLDQAREQAIGFKNMKEISAIFEIYKTKCEQYLNAHGRNWRALYKAYYEKVHAKK